MISNIDDHIVFTQLVLFQHLPNPLLRQNIKHEVLPIHLQPKSLPGNDSHVAEHRRNDRRYYPRHPSRSCPLGNPATRFLLHFINLSIMGTSIYALLALPWLVIWLHYIEASLHFAIISNQGEKSWWNRLWHIEFFRIWCIVYIIIWALGAPAGIIAIGGLARLSVFAIRLNWLRCMPWYHLGSKGIDRFAGWLPPNGRKIYFIILLAATLSLAVVETVKLWP